MAEERRVQRRERIEALDQINEDVTSLLRAAGLAVSALTNKSLDQDSSPPLSGNPVEDRKVTFQKHARDYFTIAKRLKLALESESEALQNGELLVIKRPLANVTSGEDAVTNGGMGNLDIGWLNSRNNDVMRRKEAEAWQHARELLEKSERKKHASDVTMKDSHEDEDNATG